MTLRLVKKQVVVTGNSDGIRVIIPSIKWGFFADELSLSHLHPDFVDKSMFEIHKLFFHEKFENLFINFIRIPLQRKRTTCY